MLLCAALIVAMLAYQASAGCGRWVIRESTDYLQDPIFDEAVASSTGPSSTVKPGNTSSQTGDRLQGYASSKEKTGSQISSMATGSLVQAGSGTGQRHSGREIRALRGLQAPGEGQGFGQQINFLNVIYGTARGALS